MKQGRLVRRAVSAALAGCMMFTLSAPALAESTDALLQSSIRSKSAVSLLEAENSTGDIMIGGKVIDPADYDNIVAGNYTFRYDPVLKVLTSTNNNTIRAITIEVPDDVDVVLDNKEYIPVNNLTIKGAHDVTISSGLYAAIGSKAEITCTGKVTIDAPNGNFAIGATTSSTTDGTLTIHSASEVEINAPNSSRILAGFYGKADITCDGPVTIRGKADGGSTLAKSFTYAGDYVYFTRDDEETGAIDGTVTPLAEDGKYSYLRIEEKQDAHLKVNDGTATAGGQAQTELDSFKGQKVTVTSTVVETPDRKFDGWEVVSPRGFVLAAEKLAQPEFSFLMPAGSVELTAHHSNRLDVTGGTAEVNGEAADFARPGAAVAVTAADRGPNYKFDHWEVSGDIGKTAEELKASPLQFIMPDTTVKLTAVYRAAVNVTNGTAQTGTESGTTVYALEGDLVTVTGHDSSASFSKFVGWKLEKGSLTQITDADGNVLDVTVEAKDKYLLDAAGEKLSAEAFSFTMPDAPVTLKAIYSIPAIGMDLPVIVEGGTINGTQDSIMRVKAGEKVTIKADAPANENMQFYAWKVEEGTSKDFGVIAGALGSETEPGTEEITFIMPKGAVRLTAQWSGTPAALPDPDHPMDEDFGVVPADDSKALAVAAGAALGGAVLVGGYEVATRVILHDLLPAGAAIPANRAQLALLIWNTKGKPAPAAQPTFADVADADTAQAAQWCVEQGLLSARSDDSFDPDGWLPKYRVIQVWKQAF